MSDTDDKLEPPNDPDVETSTRRETPTRSVTYPPTRWDGQAQVQASTKKYTTIPPVGHIGDDGRERLTEARAREILNARFATAGVKLIPDFAFHEGDVMVTLDGYDGGRRTGYAYISHADADVVTDFDEASEEAFNNLAAAGIAHVLLVHDHDVPTEDVLERRIDAFFAALHRNDG